MVPTFKDGQILIARKFNITVKNNDIIVIKKDNKIIIKRVIGIPYDKLKIKDGYVCVNGVKFDDRYIKDAGALQNEVILNNNQYFVMGDNRNESIDSRFEEVGIINKEEIVGLIQ